MQPPRYEAEPQTTFWKSFSHFVWNVVLFTPARVSLIGIALNLVLCTILYYGFGLGHVGLALTTGLIAVLNFLQLLWAIQKKIELGDPAEWLSFFLRISVASFACGAVAFAGDSVFLSQHHMQTMEGAAVLLLNILAAGGVYLGLTTLLGVPESVEIIALLKRKLGRGKQ